ncbi:phage baseplate assembly protein V [Diaphorobacter caeni]|uniref:phage baseplate assembly protein V n=1 Tax=Diaphorobacter caeni TaxID=2784387 RepID=UPI00188EBBE5|nr:phage baseplate assembly protein V [Diaphorobacter caeni]MBF5003364.1 phage baseplate assembly protein V [Diaphorobacter caeni]
MSQTPQQNTPQEQARKLENIASLGVVHAVNLKAARCRVQMGDNTTDWLPWFTGRAAGKDGSHWWPPVVGEQCLVLAPGGDLLQGVALLGFYSDANAAPSNRKAVEYTRWSEKDYSEYSPEAHTTHHEKKLRTEVSSTCSATMEPQEFRMEVGNGCSITMKPNQITLQAGSATLQIGPAMVVANVDVIAGGISLMNHVHTKVTMGTMLSGEPLGAGGMGGGVIP